MPRRAEAPGRVRARGIELARPDARAVPGPKGGGHPTAHCASPARVPGTAALSRTGDVRPRDVHRARRGGRHGPARAGGRHRRSRARRLQGPWPRARGDDTIPTSTSVCTTWSFKKNLTRHGADTRQNAPRNEAKRTNVVRTPRTPRDTHRAVKRTPHDAHPTDHTGRGGYPEPARLRCCSSDTSRWSWIQAFTS